jgi:hypothetical protein
MIWEYTWPTARVIEAASWETFDDATAGEVLMRLKKTMTVMTTTEIHQDTSNSLFFVLWALLTHSCGVILAQDP